MSELSTTVMSEDAAHRITERIRYTAMIVRDNVAKLQELVAEAQEGQAHTVLGYASWTAYIADVFSDAPLQLQRSERREVVAWLSGEGMSTRAIAPIVGASHMTVQNDRDAGVKNFTPEPDAVFNDEGERQTWVNPDWLPDGLPESDDNEPLPPFDPRTEEILEPEPAPAPRKVIGLDGKTYTPPTPSTPRRKPITDDARRAGLELHKALDRIETLTEDDRFNRQKEEVALHLKGHLSRAMTICQDLIAQLN